MAGARSPTPRRSTRPGTAPGAGTSDEDVTLTLRATDINNASATATVSVTVRANQSPSASATGRPTPVAGGGVVTLNGTGLRPRGRWPDVPLEQQWRRDVRRRLSPRYDLDRAPEDQCPPEHRPHPDGDRRRRRRTHGNGQRRRDGAGKRGAHRPRRPASPTTVDGGGTVRLNGTATDRDDARLTYRWSSDGGGTFDDDEALDTTWIAPRAATADEPVVPDADRDGPRERLGVRDGERDGAGEPATSSDGVPRRPSRWTERRRWRSPARPRTPRATA